jgi:vitamin B12 transporter
MVLVVGIGTTLFSFNVATAQEVPEVTLEEMVVTATRYRLPTTELGVSTTVITSEDIERRNAGDVQELLRDVAGIHVARQGARGRTTSLFFRGGESNFTLVLVDGVQVNEAGGLFDFSTLTTDNIEQIEIIRGPQSALYGSDAISGVINIITKKGEGKPTVTVSTAHGAHSENGHYLGEQKVRASGGNQSAGFSLAYGRVDDNGILDINDDFWSNVVSGRLDLYPTESWDITVTGRVEDAYLEIPTENGGDRPDSVFPGLDPDQDQEDLDIVFGLGTRFDLTQWLENSMQLGLHHQERDFKDPPNVETAFDAPPGSTSETNESRFTFDDHVNIRFPREGSVRSILTLGYEHEYEAYDLDSVSTSRFGVGPFGVFTSTATADENRTNDAVYIQEQLTIMDRLHLTGGLRIDDNSEFDTEVSPRGSVAFEIKETGTALRGAAGKGIKEPTFIENFGGFGTVGNPDLDPETSISWEVGVDQHLWDKKLQVGVTYFHNDYDDLIAFIATPFPPPAVLPPNYFNIQEAKSSGVEVEAQLQPGYGLTLGGTYTYLDTEVTDAGGIVNLFFAEGRSLIRRPNHQVSFFADWLWRNLNVHLCGRYVGEQDDTLFLVEPGAFYTYSNLRVENDDYLVVDLNASYTIDVGHPFLKDIKIFAKGQNIFDKEYEESVGYSSPRFSVMGGLEFTL